MSTHEDQSISGKSLDVVEHNSSNPPATGGPLQGTSSGSGLGLGSGSQDCFTESLGVVDRSNSEDKRSDGSNRNRTKPKEGMGHTV